MALFHVSVNLKLRSRPPLVWRYFICTDVIANTSNTNYRHKFNGIVRFSKQADGRSNAQLLLSTCTSIHEHSIRIALTA